MSSALLCFASTFVAVFALGLQSLNVNQGHYWAAAGTSLMIGTSTIALYKFIPGANWISAETICYLAGGVSGITSSMWFHRRFKAWWTEALARRREARRLRQAIARHRKQGGAGGSGANWRCSLHAWNGKAWVRACDRALSGYPPCVSPCGDCPHRSLWCVLFGHDMRWTDRERGVAGGKKCSRCPHETPGIVWPRPSDTH